MTEYIKRLKEKTENAKQRIEAEKTEAKRNYVQKELLPTIEERAECGYNKYELVWCYELHPDVKIIENELVQLGFTVKIIEHWTDLFRIIIKW